MDLVTLLNNECHLSSNKWPVNWLFNERGSMPVVHQTSLAITSISDTNMSCVMTSAGLLKVVVVGPNPLKKVLSRIYAIQAKIESL